MAKKTCITKKTYSAGFDKSKIYTYINLLRYYKNNKNLAENDFKIFSEIKNIFDKYTNKKISESRLLEIGCGQHFTMTLLFYNIGAKITGIDTDFVSPSYSPKNLYKIIKNNGFERFLKTLIRHIFFDRKYYSVIKKKLNRDLFFKGIDIRLMDACNLTFSNKLFDFIFSNAVFEHIYDVDKASKEIHRVLKDDGIIYITIDLFTSISGGHNLSWADPHTKNVKKNIAPPWDHLRNNLYPTHVYLNQLSEKDYIEIFSNYFDIIEIDYDYEGEEFLTDYIIDELKSKFSKDELLKKRVKFLLKKRNC